MPTFTTQNQGLRLLTFDLYTHVVFLLQDHDVIPQKSSLFVSELFLPPVSWGLSLTNATKPWDSYGYDTTVSQVEFWLHTLAEQSSGGEVQQEYVTPSETPSSSSAWKAMAPEAHQTRPDQEVRDLGAPTASASAVLLWCVIDPKPQSFSSVNVRRLDQVVSIDIASFRLLWFHDHGGTGWRISRSQPLPLRPLPPHSSSSPSACC